jgi:hypothetical protein
MTKGEIVESVLLAASGYRLSQDIPVRREDIKALLPEAMAYAIEKWNNNSLRSKFQELQIIGAHEHSFDFLTTIEVMPTLDAARGYYYVELPQRVLNIRGSSGIQQLFPAQGLGYVKVSSRQSIIGIEHCQTFYWHESFGGKSRLYIFNIGLPVCIHYAQYLFNPADLKDDDEVPLPSGTGFEVVSLLTEFFVKRRGPDENTDDKPKQVP